MAVAAPPAEVDREEIARVALRRCGKWCRDRAGTPYWRSLADPDWEQVACLAAFHIATRFRPRDALDTPHRNFVHACCRGALSQTTATDRRRKAATGFDPIRLRVPIPDLDTLTSPATPEPWAEASINEEAPHPSWP